MPLTLVVALPLIDLLPAGGATHEALIGRLLLLLLLLLRLPVGILSSLSLYAIAKRWSLPAPWLAWIPGGNFWILGALSDHVRQTKKRKLPMRVLMLAVATLTAALLLMNPVWLDGWLGAPAVFGTFLALIISAVAMADVYAACRPDRTALYTMATICLPFAVPVCFGNCAYSEKSVA